MVCAATSDQEKTAWILASIALMVVGMFVFWGCRCRRSPVLTRSTKFETLVTWRSAFIFMCMGIPLAIPEVKSQLPKNVLLQYYYLPFWYVYLVVRTFGEVFETAYQTMTGYALAVGALFILQWFMPGGAGPLSDDPAYRANALLPGGFNLYVAIIYGCAFAYCIFASSWHYFIKKYAMAVFTELFVHFVSPYQIEEDWSAVFWLYDIIPVWKGAAPSLLYVLIASCFCGAITLPCGHVASSARRSAASLCEDIAADIIVTFEQVIMHFREGSSAYLLHSLDLHVSGLGAKLSEVDALLHSARWETSDAKLNNNRKLCTFLKGCHQTLCILLSDLRELSHSTHGDDLIEVAVNLDGFLVALNDATMSFCSPAVLLHGRFNKMQAKAIQKFKEDAEGHLISALRVLEAIEGPRHYMELVFIESLMTCPSLFNVLLTEEEEHTTKTRFWEGWTWKGIRDRFPSRQRHVQAVGLTVSWTICLLWSIFRRDYNVFCVLTVAWAFTESVSSLFDLTMKRVMGTGLGLAVGVIPASLIPTAARSFPQDLIVYFVAMYAVWAGAIYGHVAKDAKWAYAFKLFAAFGGTEMMRFVPACSYATDLGQDTSSSTFFSQVDAFVALIVMTAVDLCVAVNSDKLTVQEVGNVIPKCIKDFGEIVKGFREQETSSVDLSRLREGIQKAKQVDRDSRGEDLIWSNLMAPPYSVELVPAIIDALDQAFVSAKALAESASRCSIDLDVPDLLSQLIPGGNADYLNMYAFQARAMLLSGVPHSMPGDEINESEFSLHAQRTHNLRQLEYEASNENVASSLALVALRVRALAVCLSVRQLGSLFVEHARMAHHSDEILSGARVSMAHGDGSILDHWMSSTESASKWSSDDVTSRSADSDSRAGTPGSMHSSPLRSRARDRLAALNRTASTGTQGNGALSRAVSTGSRGNGALCRAVSTGSRGNGALSRAVSTGSRGQGALARAVSTDSQGGQLAGLSRAVSTDSRGQQSSGPAPSAPSNRQSGETKDSGSQPASCCVYQKRAIANMASALAYLDYDNRRPHSAAGGVCPENHRNSAPSETHYATVTISEGCVGGSERPGDEDQVNM